MRRSHSIDISRTRFAELLASRRRALGLSKIDLAEKAALSGRVVHQIETGSRIRFLEKTLLLLADAVETPLEDLLRPPESNGSAHPGQISPAADAGPPPSLCVKRPIPCYRRRSWQLTALAAAVLIILVPAILGALRAVRTPQVEVVGNTVRARNANSGEVTWSRTFESNVNMAEPSPWRDGSVIAMLDVRGSEGGKVLLLDGSTGRTIWDRSPDPDLAESAFGEDAFDDLPEFTPIMGRYLDLDGDGTDELAVVFANQRSCPSCVMVLNRRGVVLGQYFNRGHIHDMTIVDLDGAGKQSLVCAGASSCRLFHGGTVFILDQEHWNGAAVDPFTGGEKNVMEGSRRRILIPPFDAEVARFLGGSRHEAFRVFTTRLADGSLAIMATVGVHGFNFHLMLDPDLNPLDLKRTDNVMIEVARWPVEHPATYGPNCPVWREQWMRGIMRVDRHALAGDTDMPAYQVDGVAVSVPER